MDRKFRIAIVGGGICGCSLANGLLRCKSFEFDVFESKPTFGERGAAVSLDVNARNALRSMGLDPEQMLKHVGAVEVDASRCIVRLREISTGTDGYPCVLEFEDGSSYQADAVIGCDGIHPTVRRILLQDEYPDRIESVFGRYRDARGWTTPEKAAERFGTDLFDPRKPNKIALTGNGAFMGFRPSDDSTRYTIIVSAAASQSYDGSARKQELTRGILESAYCDWDPKFRDAVIECLLCDGSNVVFPQFESSVAPLYTNGRLCIIGDAAHAMLPWMGVGAEMAIEDAAVLAAALGGVEDGGADGIRAALFAYQQTRQGICERLMRQNHEAAKIITGQYGLDPAKISVMKPEKWWAAIQALDISGHMETTIAVSRRLMKDETSMRES